MAAIAGALVLNIGTLSPHWVDAMLLAGPRGERARNPGRARSGRRGRDALPHGDRKADPRRGATWPCCAATQARWQRSSASRPRCAASNRSARAAIRPSSRARRRAALGLVASVTGPVDHVSDGERSIAIANGDPMLATITGTGCMSSALTGCFLAVNADRPLEAAAAEALVAFGVAGEDAARDAKGPGSFHVGLYDALAALDPGDARRAGAHRVKVHAIVADLETARRAVAAGATVVQLRVKAPTARDRRARARLPRARRDVRRQRRRRGGDRARRRRRASRPGRRRAPSVHGAPGCCSAARRRRSSRRSPRTRTTSASGRCGRRRRSTTPTARSASTGCARSARGHGPGGRNRRHRRVERRRMHPGRCSRRRRDPRRDRSGAEAGGR